MKAMKKILTTLALAALSIISVHALPADPTPRTIRQKDGTTVTLVLHGDEHHHWYTNLSGQRYALSTDGFFRPVAATKASVAGSGKRRMTKSPNRASITQGSKKFLVVLIEFQDLAFLQGRTRSQGASQDPILRQVVIQYINDPVQQIIDCCLSVRGLEQTKVIVLFIDERIYFIRNRFQTFQQAFLWPGGLFLFLPGFLFLLFLFKEAVQREIASKDLDRQLFIPGIHGGDRKHRPTGDLPRDEEPVLSG